MILLCWKRLSCTTITKCLLHFKLFQRSNLCTQTNTIFFKINFRYQHYRRYLTWRVMVYSFHRKVWRSVPFNDKRNMQLQMDKKKKYLILGITDTTMAAKWTVYDLTHFYEPFKSIATTQGDGDKHNLQWQKKENRNIFIMCFSSCNINIHTMHYYVLLFNINTMILSLR